MLAAAKLAYEEKSEREQNMAEAATCIDAIHKSRPELRGGSNSEELTTNT